MHMKRKFLIFVQTPLKKSNTRLSGARWEVGFCSIPVSAIKASSVLLLKPTFRLFGREDKLPQVPHVSFDFSNVHLTMVWTLLGPSKGNESF